MAVAAVNLRALRNEADWLPEKSFEEVAMIRETLSAAGLPDQQVNAMVGWLVAKASGQPDRTNSVTRATYRKVLAGLKSPLRSELRSDTSDGGQRVPAAA